MDEYLCPIWHMGGCESIYDVGSAGTPIDERLIMQHSVTFAGLWTILAMRPRGCSWPDWGDRYQQHAPPGKRLNSCAKQQQQPFHESEMLCVQHTGSSLLVVFFSL
jgi:hypothetical protein